MTNLLQYTSLVSLATRHIYMEKKITFDKKSLAQTAGAPETRESAVSRVWLSLCARPDDTTPRALPSYLYLLSLQG